MKDVESARDDKGSPDPGPQVWPFAENEPTRKRCPDERRIRERSDDRGRCSPERLDQAEVTDAAEKARCGEEGPAWRGRPLPVEWNDGAGHDRSDSRGVE